jgi:HAD superfamily hydrolase (TIGR01490 family)
MTDKIAFFDFDGTITTRDTLLEFIRFCKGTTGLYTGFLLKSPWLLAYKLKIISNQRAKEAVLRFFYRKLPAEWFEGSCTRFAEQKLPALIRTKAAKELTRLQELGYEIVIVSASPGDWIRPWAASIGATLIATRLATDDKGRLTGKIVGKNCHGEEKVNRIHLEYRLEDYRSIYAYGDTKGDLPMLRLAHHPFMKPFR